jgi:hypothetical protein
MLRGPFDERTKADLDTEKMYYDETEALLEKMRNRALPPMRDQPQFDPKEVPIMWSPTGGFYYDPTKSATQGHHLMAQAGTEDVNMREYQLGTANILPYSPLNQPQWAGPPPYRAMPRQPQWAGPPPYQAMPSQPPQPTNVTPNVPPWLEAMRSHLPEQFRFRNRFLGYTPPPAGPPGPPNPTYQPPLSGGYPTAWSPPSYQPAQPPPLQIGQQYNPVMGGPGMQPYKPAGLNFQSGTPNPFMMQGRSGMRMFQGGTSDVIIDPNDPALNINIPGQPGYVPPTSTPAAPTPPTAAVRPTARNPYQDSVTRGLVDSGARPHVVAALLGDIQQESSFNPRLSDDKGTSWGLFQVGKPMFDQFEATQNKAGINPSSPTYSYNQAQYIANRFKQQHPDRWQAMQDAPDAPTALRIFRGTKDWGYGIAGKRYDYAQQYAQNLTGLPQGDYPATPYRYPPSEATTQPGAPVAKPPSEWQEKTGIALQGIGKDIVAGAQERNKAAQDALAAISGRIAAVPTSNPTLDQLAADPLGPWRASMSISGR